MENKKELSGAQMVLECLKEQGIDTVFGYPGGSVIPLYDALYDYSADIRHILTAHEQGAVHAADGYARSSGKVGVCFVTSGPGATNTVTGIATAYMDSVPLVIITGQVPCHLLGKDAFQEVDITGITMPVTKHNYLVENVEDVCSTIRDAFAVAQSGRPGPVLVDIPKNIFIKKGTYHCNASTIKPKHNVEAPSDGFLKEIAELINKSQRPVICAGGGIVYADAYEELYEFATKAGIPVVNTLMGLSTFPRTNNLSIGLVGMHGSKEANLLVVNTDLMLAMGTRFNDRSTGKLDSSAKAKVIHFEIDASEIDKNRKTHMSVQGNIKTVLQKLIKYIDAKPNTNSYVGDDTKSAEDFTPKNILKMISSSFDSDTIVATDVGQHQMWVAQNWPFEKPRSFLTSGGLGTMGFGLGAAIGAKLANPDKKVVHVTGDGSFRMNCNELATVSGYEIPVVTVLLNNQVLGMVRQWQKLFHDKRYSQTDIAPNINYVKLADAYGIRGVKVSNLKELRQALDVIKTSNKPEFIECVIGKDECVFPMVAPDSPLDNLITE